LSMDIAVSIDGWVADSARSIIVGAERPEDRHLVEATEVALDAAIAAALPGNRLGDISAAIGAVAAEYGYPVNTEFGGHGLGRTMHEDPHVANTGRAGRGLVLRPGLTLALEPWFAAGTDKIVYDPDGWTIRSADGSRTAHSEHTIEITEGGPLVLTKRERVTEERWHRTAPDSRNIRSRGAGLRAVRYGRCTYGRKAMPMPLY